VNAPKCPFANFQQDGHMTTVNPVGRVNYEPNSWGPDEGGPREDAVGGFETYPADEAGAKRRLRPESFADHYSQARQFFLSQDPVEQKHIGDAFVFELSKVERLDIRERMVANLRNVDDGLARTVADGLGLETLPKKTKPASTPIADLPDAPSLSILRNPPDSLAGRKVGALVTDGADSKLLGLLEKAVEADQKIDGGPSVLYDAVVILASEAGSKQLATDATTRDFIADAYAHCKFIGVAPTATSLLDAAGVDADAGVVTLAPSKGSITAFLETCHAVRYWPREATVDRT
jgi:catalase